MRFLETKKTILTALILVFSLSFGLAQNGNVTINQSPEIDKLLTYKTQINQETGSDNRFKIQIFNGSLRNAEKAKSRFQSNFPGIVANIKFETPNYKVWVGNFRSSLEADKHLVRIKKKFPKAFRPSRTKKKK